MKIKINNGYSNALKLLHFAPEFTNADLYGENLMWPLVLVTTGDFDMPVITLPDGSQREFDAPVSVLM